MATHCDLIEKNVDSVQSNVNKCFNKNSSKEVKTSTMTHECEEEHCQTGQQCVPKVVDYPLLVGDDVFENAFEASMEDLEHAEADGYKSDSESANEEDDYAEPTAGLMRSNGSEDLSCTSGLGCETLSTFPRTGSFECHSSSDSDVEDDGDSNDGLYTSINLSPKYFPLDKSRPYLLPFIERRRLSQCKEEDEDDGEKSPQTHAHANGSTKIDKSSASAMHPTPPPPPPPPTKDKASVTKFMDLERLRQQFMHKIDNINTSNIEEIKTVAPIEHVAPPPPPPIPPSILPPSLINLLQSAKSVPTRPMIKANVEYSTPTSISSSSTNNTSVIPTTPTSTTTGVERMPASSPEPFVVRGKFTVTKALETPDLQQLRGEAQKLKHLNASNNAQTISFPSSFGGYSSVQGLFSQRFGSSNKQPTVIVPHLSKQFFDTSLVEIRSPIDLSNQSLNVSVDVESVSKCPRTGGSSARLNLYGVDGSNQSNKCDTSVVQKPTGNIHHLDEVWIKRNVTPPSNSSTVNSPVSIPSTAAIRKLSTEYDSALESGRSTAVQSEDVSL